MSLGKLSVTTARQAPVEAGREDSFDALEGGLREFPSFGVFADAYVESHRSNWRNAKHAAQWNMTLTEYCAPIRAIPVNMIDTEAVLKVLQPIWSTIPETANRLRGRIENVLDAAKAKGYLAIENPARWRGHLKSLLPSRQRITRGHHAALAYDDLPAFIERSGHCRRSSDGGGGSIKFGGTSPWKSHCLCTQAGDVGHTHAGQATRAGHQR